MTCVHCQYEFCWRCKEDYSHCRSGPICRSKGVWKHPIWGTNSLERAITKTIILPVCVGVGCASLGAVAGVAIAAGTVCLVGAGPALMIRAGARYMSKQHTVNDTASANTEIPPLSRISTPTEDEMMAMAIRFAHAKRLKENDIFAIGEDCLHIDGVVSSVTGQRPPFAEELLCTVELQL